MKTESYVVRAGLIFINRPKTTLALLVFSFLFMLAQMPGLRIDTSAESFLLPTAEPLVNFDKFRHQFGRDEFFIVVITGVDVFSLDFLATLRDFHQALETDVSKLQSVESLVNTRSIYGADDELIAENLMEKFPETEEDLALIKERIRGKEIYYDRLINRAEDTVAIMVKQLPYTIVKNADGTETYVNMVDTEIAQGAEEIQAVADRFKDRLKGGKVYIGGTPAMGSYLSKVIQRDFGAFTTVAILMVGFVLWILFRRFSGVFIPLTVMVISIVICIGLMPILDFPVQITTSILPTFLLAVCVGDSVHLLSIFYRHYDGGASKRESIVHALSHSGVAVLFTTLTTMAGVATFMVSEIQPVVSLGLFACVGSMVAFLLTIITVPTLVTVLPIRRKAVAEDFDKMKESGLMYRFTRFSIHLSTKYPRTIVFLSVVCLVAAAMQVPNLRFSQDSLGWLPDDNSVKQAVYKIEEKITGTTPVEIVIDTGTKQGALDPQLLKKVDAWVSALKGREISGVKVISVNSLVDLVKETNQAFNGNTPDAHRVPDDKELIAQELLMVEMDKADDLYSFVDRDFQKLRITVIVPWNDAVVYRKFLDALTEDYNKAVGAQYKMHLTGITPIFAVLLTAMMQSAADSYLLSAIAISLMMILLVRNVVDGLLSMIPNLIPIITTLAFMVLVDIPMDVFTVLIGSVAMGICVDDTVHFMHGFKTGFDRHGDALRSIDETLMTSGKALITTSVVMFWGFMTFTLSDLEGMRNFSMMMALCIAMALLADFLLAPALMMLRYGRKKPPLAAQ